MSKVSTPPNWAPGAIATKYGWANPKTGEILVANRRLPNPNLDFVKGCPYVPAPTESQVDPKDDVILDMGCKDDELVESVFIEISTETSEDSQIVKKRRGRPPKTPG